MDYSQTGIMPLFSVLAGRFLSTAPPGKSLQHKIFNSEEALFILFFFFAICDFGVISKKALPNSRSWRFMPVFSPNSFIVLTLMFRYMIHWVNFYVWSACGYPVVQHHFLKDFFPPLNSLGILVENQLTINVLVYFWTLNSIPLIFMSIHLLVSHCLKYCSFVVSSDIGKCESSSSLPFWDCIWPFGTVTVPCEF